MDATAAFRDEATDFKSRWATFARECDPPLPDTADEPLATVTFTVSDLRRQVAIAFFSYGLVHGERERRRLEQLLPRDADRAPTLRLVSP